MEPFYYPVNLTWTRERRGIISSPDLNSEIEVATPPEFPGGVPGIWSPEHLFTASVVSCFMTTFLAIAENSQLDFLSFNYKAEGKLEKAAGKFSMTEVVLEPVLEISAEADEEKALEILSKAEAACLITNSLKATVVMNPVIKFPALA